MRTAVALLLDLSQGQQLHLHAPLPPRPPLQHLLSVPPPVLHQPHLLFVPLHLYVPQPHPGVERLLLSPPTPIPIKES
jgi:hypothetical protein